MPCMHQVKSYSCTSLEATRLDQREHVLPPHPRRSRRSDADVFCLRLGCNRLDPCLCRGLRSGRICTCQVPTMIIEDTSILLRHLTSN